MSRHLRLTRPRLYRLAVDLISGPIDEAFVEQNPYVGRTIAIRGDQTLADLHGAIFAAFDRFDEHMYEFQIGGKGPMDPKARSYGPSGYDGGDRVVGDAAETTLDSLNLRFHELFGYWFDFGDDWWHQVTVEAIEDEVPPGDYPCVVGRVGASPPQYLEVEGDEGDDEWDDDGEDVAAEEELAEVLGEEGMAQLKAEMMAFMSKHPDLSLEDVAARFEEQMIDATRRPCAAVGGLSLEQVDDLLFAEWGTADAVIGFEAEVPLDAFAQAPFFLNTRILLEAVRDAGGAPLTAKGNLKRAFVAEVFERMVLTEEVRRSFQTSYKVLNEPDLWPLHLCRLVAETAKLLRRRRGRLVPASETSALLESQAHGTLYGRIFRTQFQEMELGCLDRYPELPALQDSVGYLLYRLHCAGNAWLRIEEVFEQGLLPEARRELESDRAALQNPHAPLVDRILRPLAAFGLIEPEYQVGRYSIPTLVRLRRTPLFEQVLRFRLGDGPEA